MIQKVIMPKMGQTVEEAVIEKWHVKEGDAIEKGQILFELTTDKATIEAESYYTGTLLRVFRAEGDTVPVNAVIAVVGEPGEEIPPEIAKEAESVESAAAGSQESPTPEAEAPGTPAVPEPAPSRGKVVASHARGSKPRSLE